MKFCDFDDYIGLKNFNSRPPKIYFLQQSCNINIPTQCECISVQDLADQLAR